MQIPLVMQNLKNKTIKIKLCLPYNMKLNATCPINGLRLRSSILYQPTIKCNDSKYKKNIQRNL